MKNSIPPSAKNSKILEKIKFAPFWDSLRKKPISGYIMRSASQLNQVGIKLIGIRKAVLRYTADNCIPICRRVRFFFYCATSKFVERFAKPNKSSNFMCIVKKYRDIKNVYLLWWNIVRPRSQIDTGICVYAG